jgi:predicted metal-dependent enzyme (double-stranded beta helix superfamily)
MPVAALGVAAFVMVTTEFMPVGLLPAIAAHASIADLLRVALEDGTLATTVFDETSPERQVVYEDPQLGFCILAHRYADARKGPPHDHGPSWAIYGQSAGETVLSDWVLVDTPATPGQRRKVKVLREYTMRPGDVHVYNERAIHAPNRSGPTRLIRIEGTNLERVARGTYEPV